MADNLQQKLAAWLETSGRALELRTARMFNGLEGVMYANQSVPYEDVSSSQQREGDVAAVYRWVAPGYSHALEAAVECKATKDQPWVGFYDHRRAVPEDVSNWLLTGGDWLPKDLEGLCLAWREEQALATDRVATHAVSAFGKDNGKNLALDAALQALSFAKARCRKPLRYAGDPKGSKPGNAVAAVVVTQAPLFTCELTVDGDLVLESVDRFDLWVHRLGEPQRVYVRSELALAEMAKAMEAVRDALGPLHDKR